MEGELLYKLDENGICASAGSACSTANPMPSHVLTAIGLDSKLAENTLRITFGKDNTLDDINYLIDTLNKIKSKKM